MTRGTRRNGPWLRTPHALPPRRGRNATRHDASGPARVPRDVDRYLRGSSA